jgi:hypothetical protein
MKSASLAKAHHSSSVGWLGGHRASSRCQTSRTWDAFASLYPDVYFTGAVIEIPVSADDDVGQLRRAEVRGGRSVLKFDQYWVADLFEYLGEVGVGVRLPEVGDLDSRLTLLVGRENSRG